ncbi:MAG: hypothetical protein GY786_04120 [Proteobacteria bacterium]|nr:hypothetical protein [Pseudomonadota bacterium]
MLKLGAFLFKYRDYTPIPWIILMLAYCRTDNTSLLTGGALIVIGELIRIYGVAFIGGVSRTRTYSAGQKVIKFGPFAYVRNPLYLGNLLLSSGLVVIANVDLEVSSQDSRFFILLFMLFFFLQYVPIVNWEENNLKSVFGKEYEDYITSVPRWIPKLRSDLAGTEEVEKDFKAAIKSEKNTFVAIVVLIPLLLWRSGYLA